MNETNPVNKYKEINLSTSTRKTQQVVMLYEGAIKFMKLAQKAIEEGNIQERFNNTERASKIIDGLHCCLDPEKGGEVTNILDKFYTHLFMRIMKLNMNNSTSECEEIIKDLRKMKEAWVEVDIKTQQAQDRKNKQAPGESGIRCKI